MVHSMCLIQYKNTEDFFFPVYSVEFYQYRSEASSMEEKERSGDKYIWHSVFHMRQVFFKKNPFGLIHLTKLIFNLKKI